MKSLSIVCREASDLYQVLTSNNIIVPRYDSIFEALTASPVGASVMLLADDYPHRQVEFGDEFYKIAKERRLRLYIEFPAALPGGERLGLRPHQRVERGIVAADCPSPNLPEGTLFSMPGAVLVDTEAQHPWLLFGKVAGFDRLAFPLGETAVAPLLFSFEENLLVCTSSFSQFITARYAPNGVWQSILSMLINWLQPTQEAVPLQWKSLVRPSFHECETIPQNASPRAIVRAVDWFFRARLLYPADFEALYSSIQVDSLAIQDDLPLGDGSAGVMEGFTSQIDHQGIQSVRWWRRADCAGEVSGALAVASLVSPSTQWTAAARNLADWLFNDTLISQGDRANPAHPAYGLLGWHDRKAYNIYADGWSIYYGDDNARAILGIIATSSALGTSEWDQGVARTIIANFRTSGKCGFRQDRIKHESLESDGWRSYFDSETVSYAPHFQAYLWACYLWAYSKTGYPGLLKRTVAGIEQMMSVYPHGWHWTNGLQQERARMLLALAWLIRVDDTPLHRQWLNTIASDLLAHQETSGAIREEIGDGVGKYGPPASHEAYGKAEAPLLQANGDPVADLLYTVNFAFLGMHEAAEATGAPELQQAADRLEAFLLRVQVDSRRSDLNGAWFRAFDFKRWDYWGSDSDGDWGAWCVETGWTQAWISLVLALRQQQTSLWELSRNSKIKKSFELVCAEMLPELDPNHQTPAVVQ